jgi:alpha-beta hydrolase superfamily lysophospholipase
MTLAATFLISTDLPTATLARRTAADVAKHGAVVLLAGRGSQARNLRKLYAALCGAGYQPHYYSHDATHVMVVEPPGQPPSQALGLRWLSN